MELATQPFPTQTRASISVAKSAYFVGDFERCLEICASIRLSDVTLASEVALLKARSYLRTGRPREAQTTIAETRALHTTLDAALTARMIEATALVRQGIVDTGIAMLEDAARDSSKAHFAIRSEIALCTALGYWAKREIDIAETYLVLVDPRSDIIHARALELQAWCHTVRHDYREAALFFKLTLLRLDDCQASDCAVTATAISTLAIFAAELFDPSLSGFIEGRAQNLDWSSGLLELKYVTLEHQALFQEFAGDTLRAYQVAAQAQEAASTISDQVCGWVLRSAIATAAGETYCATIFSYRAQDLLETIDTGALDGEQRFVLLSAAECCARLQPDKADRLFTRYHQLGPIDIMSSSSGDPRRAAYESFVAGVVAKARGNRDQAQEFYRSAFDRFRGLGYVRRAIIAAHAFLQLAESEDLRSYVTTQMAGTANYITRSLEDPVSELIASLERHPVVASLPRTQRGIVLLVCLGKSNKEIAHLRNVGEQTIKNALTKSIFPAFGVSSRAALLGLLLRDGQAARVQIALK
jgi:DNA-binding CsgD family transcriptional regulator